MWKTVYDRICIDEYHEQVTIVHCVEENKLTISNGLTANTIKRGWKRKKKRKKEKKSADSK